MVANRANLAHRSLVLGPWSGALSGTHHACQHLFREGGGDLGKKHRSPNCPKIIFFWVFLSMKESLILTQFSDPNFVTIDVKLCFAGDGVGAGLD